MKCKRIHYFPAYKDTKQTDVIGKTSRMTLKCSHWLDLLCKLFVWAAENQSTLSHILAEKWQHA